MLRTIGIGTAVGVAGLGGTAGTAVAWERQETDFKGCSEVWFVLHPDDVTYDPPTVARVVVALPNGDTACRDVEFTPENTDPIPGQYGDAPVRKVRAGEGEKILGVIFYNYREDRFSSPSCIHVNHNQCATTPGTPSFESASCVESARANGGYDCDVEESEPAGRRPGRGRR